MSEKKWSSFTPAARKDWLAAAQKELHGEDPLQKLVHQSGNIRVAPYYDNTDLPDTRLFVLEPSKNQWSEPRYWANAPKVVVHDARDANRISLQHLQAGADAIFFQIEHADINVADLLAAIELPYCVIIFAGHITPSFIASFISFAGMNFNVSQINGAMFHEKPDSIANAITDFRGWKNFYAAGIQVSPSPTPTETLTQTLLDLVKILDGGKPSEVSQQLSVSLDVSHDLFNNIAFLKAMRILVNALFAGYNITSGNLFIHGRCAPWNNEKLQPHENMLAGTTAAMSAILGGCDALTVLPAQPNNEMEVRVARNVSLILREEARLSLTADPTAGSYYIESLINTLVTNTWSDFLKKVNH